MADPRDDGVRDTRLLEHWQTAVDAIAGVVALIAAILLGAWLWPPLSRWLPYGWELSRANTSLCLLAAAVSLGLTSPRLAGDARAPTASRVLALFVALIATASIVEYLTGVDLQIDRLLMADYHSTKLGRMSPQTGAALLLLAAVLAGVGVRRLTRLIDVFATILTGWLLLLLAGQVFGAVQLYGSDAATLTSPQTLACLLLLSAGLTMRRADAGLFAVLTADTLGSRVLRLLTPVLVALPFVLQIGARLVERAGLLTADYAAAVITAVMSLAGMLLVFRLGAQLNRSEQRLSQLSLSDELTGAYNRRGFLELAGEAHRRHQLRRVRSQLLFIDVDGLKRINDTLGHDQGSRLLCDIVDLVHAACGPGYFVGRLGGDEFAVYGVADDGELLARIEQSMVAFNASGVRDYQVGASIGLATMGEEPALTLEAMLDQADRHMYQRKQQRRGPPAEAGTPGS